MAGIAISAGVLLCAVLCAVYIHRRSRRRVECPACGRSVDQSELIVDEPYCCYCADRFAKPDVESSPGQYCHRCGVTADDAARLDLWDGESYCESCVAAALPDLVTFARQNQQLEDEAPGSGWRMFWTILVVTESILLVIFGAVMLMSGSQIPLLSEISWAHLGNCLLAIGGLLPVVAPLALLVSLWYVYNRPRVTVRNGLLTVRFGRRTAWTFPLAECSWFVGSAAWGNLLGTIPLSFRRAVIIALPRQPRKHQKYAVVGHTPLKREIWTAFLRLADVPKTHAPWPPRKK